MIMEKPLAVRLGEGRDLVDAAKGHHVQIGYAENHARAPLTIKAMQHVQAGDIGKLREIRCVFGHGGPLEGAWQWDMATAGGGGAQLDLGSHVVAASLHMAGQPRIAQVTRAQTPRAARARWTATRSRRACPWTTSASCGSTAGACPMAWLATT